MMFIQTGDLYFFPVFRSDDVNQNNENCEYYFENNCCPKENGII